MNPQTQIVPKSEVLRSVLVADRKTSRVLFHIPAAANIGVNLGTVTALIVADSIARNTKFEDYKLYVETTAEENAPIFEAAKTLKFAQKIATLPICQNDREFYTSTHKITEREKQVLHFVDRGYGNKAIADQMNIGERTVKFHVSSLLAKFHVHSRSELQYKLNHGYRVGEDELKHSLKLPERTTDAANEDSSRSTSEREIDLRAGTGPDTGELVSH